MNAAGTPQLPLKDIHLPPAVSAWPPAPGWWIIVIGGIVITALSLYLFKRWRDKTAYRRAAAALAHQVFEQFNQHMDHARLAADCSELMRRVSRSAYGASASGLIGEPWLAFLDSKIAHQKNAPRFMQLRYELLQAPYQTTARFAADNLHACVLFWIRHHKVSA